jgi:phospholipid/cholesterol/gamma-HCH transport system substrate-binding protein
MDQFKSNKETTQEIPLPRRTITLEFLVGIFTLITVAAAGYLAVGLGDIRFVNTGEKYITAEFNNVSGLKPGASVELAGVPVGTVDAIQLKGYFAEVVLRINRDFDLKDEDNLSIRTKGIIGDRYVKIVPGGSQVVIKDGGKVSESNTLSVIDFEELIEKVVSHYSDDSNGKDAK